MSLNEFIDTLRERADIVEVIGEYTELRKKGKDWRGACPIHGGKNPSNFAVFPTRGTYKCFSDCGKGGDVFTFLMAKEGVDFIGACRILAQKLGLQWPERRQRMSREEKRRREVQGSFSSGGAGWEQVGLSSAISTFHLGARDEEDGRTLLLPVWGSGDASGAPGGWLRYRIEGSAPRPLGLAKESRPGIADSLFVQPSALNAAREDLLLFVPDPALAVRIYELGYRAVFSVVAPSRKVGDAWLTVEQAKELRERSKGRLGRLALAVPYRSGDAEKTRTNQRALHATEVVLLSAGIEPLVVNLPASDEALFGWGWVAGKTAEDISEDVDRRAFDVFDLRVSSTQKYLLAGRITPAQAIQKLVEPLRAAQASSTLLYECYVAWATHCLRGVDRASLEAAVRIGDGEEAEAF